MAIDYTKRPGSEPVSLTKVTLTKSAPTVSLTKQGSATGIMRVNLNWTARQNTGGGLLSRLQRPIDLDLGCLYEFTDGTKGVVQALGNSFKAGLPQVRDALIWLDGDDRSGASAGGENLYINLEQLPHIRRVLVFALIYQGVANWAAANAVATLYPAAGPEVEVRLDNPRNGAQICAIAMVENTGSDLAVRREENYIDGSQPALDQAYRWGMQWTPGRK